MRINPILRNNYLSLNFTRNQKPVYVVNKKGEYKRYESRSAIARDLNCEAAVVTKGILKDGSVYGNYFIDASKVEKPDENGNIVVDKAKLAQLVHIESSRRAIYAINLKDGSFKKYENLKKAAQELNIHESSISKNIPLKKPVKNYMFAIAYDIEQLDENGNLCINNAKLAQLMQGAISSRAVYVADLKDGSCKRYDSQSDIVQDLKMTHADVSNYVLNKIKNNKGYVFIRAKDVETVDENGQIRLDKNSLISQLNETLKEKKTIYVINPDGSYSVYQNKSKAAQALNVNYEKIGKSLEKATPLNGHILLKAQDIEYYDDNMKLCTDNEKISYLIAKSVFAAEG